MPDPSTWRSRSRTGLAVVGAAALLVTALHTVTYAATGQSVILGKSNTANKTTTIKTTGNGPALKLKGKKSKPPLSVNSSKLVKKLNADLVDGKTLDQIAPTVYTSTIGAENTTGNGGEVAYRFRLPAGTYRMSIDGLLDLGMGDDVTCLFVDFARYLGSGGSDIGSYFLAPSIDDVTGPTLHGSVLAKVEAGRDLVWACGVPTTTEFARPIMLTIERVDRTSGIPGQVLFGPRPGKPLPTFP